jgi:hypothetical protein
VAQRHALGLADHLLEAGDVAGVHRVDAPQQAHAPRRPLDWRHHQQRHGRPLARDAAGGRAGHGEADDRRRAHRVGDVAALSGDRVGGGRLGRGLGEVDAGG